MSARNIALFSAAATLAGTAALVSPPAASADVPSATDVCKAGKAPDASQTVFLSGTSGHAFYPRGVDPDNALFPGDVVTVEIDGTLRYDATHTTGPAGSGDPNANGIRPYAATAQWNNNPSGQVGDPMAAVSLRKCTAVTGKAGVRLAYGIRDADLSNNGGGFTITTHVWKAPGRLTIDGTEVTQGVQNREGQVALIGKKRTFIRVYLHHEYDGLTYMLGVTATMRVPGYPEAVYPLVNSQTTSLVGGSNPRTLNNSFLFEVPQVSTGEGTRQAVVTITPPDDRGGGWSVTKHVPMTFGPVTRLHAVGVRYSYYNVPAAMTTQMIGYNQQGLTAEAGWWQARSLASWEPMRRLAENALPVARLSITDDAPAGTSTSPWGSASFDCKAGQRPNGFWYCDGFADALKWATHLVDNRCPNGGCLYVLLQPEMQPDGNSHGYCHCVSFPREGTAGGNSLINIQGEPTAAIQGTTLAHEIGHYFSLEHTWDDPHFHATFENSPGIGSMVGLRYTPSIEPLPGRNTNGTIATYDLMSYAPAPNELWFSVYDYCKAMHYEHGRHPTCYPGWDA